MNTASLLWGVLFGSLGAAYFMYGKKQAAIVPLLCGIALMGFSYFVSNVWLMVLIGAALAATPYFFRR